MTTLPPLLLKGDTGACLLKRTLSLNESDCGTCLFEGILEGLEGGILSGDAPRQLPVSLSLLADGELWAVGGQGISSRNLQVEGASLRPRLGISSILFGRF